MDNGVECTKAAPSKELIDAVADAYVNPEDPGRGHATLLQLAKAFNLTTMTVRKMLITAGVYDTNKSRKVLELYHSGHSVEQIMAETGLKYASVLSYIPYSRTVYNLAFATEDAKCYRAKRARLEEEKKQAEEAQPYLTAEPLTDEDLWNFPESADKLQGAMPFVLTRAQMKAADLIKETMEKRGMLMIYGNGNGKSSLLQRLVGGHLPGIAVDDQENVLRYDGERYRTFSMQMYSLMTESCLMDRLAEGLAIPMGRLMKEEKRERLLQGMHARAEEGRVLLIFQDLDITEKKSFDLLRLLRDLNAAGTCVIFSSQNFTYDEVMNEHSRKRYRDEATETLRADLRMRCTAYHLTSMTRDEVFRYLDQIERIYRLQFTMGAREELVEMAQEPIRNGNMYFGIQTGSILTMNVTLKLAIALVAEIRSQEKLEKRSEAEAASWRQKRLHDIIRKCNCREVDGNRLITRNMIYYLYRERTGGIDPNDLP